MIAILNLNWDRREGNGVFLLYGKIIRFSNDLGLVKSFTWGKVKI